MKNSVSSVQLDDLEANPILLANTSEERGLVDSTASHIKTCCINSFVCIGVLALEYLLISQNLKIHEYSLQSFEKRALLMIGMICIPMIGCCICQAKR